jgi:hypothetical protein
MITKQAENLLVATTAWFCRSCGALWLAAPAGADESWRLHEAIEPVGGLSGSAAAWIVSGPDPAICPVCGGSLIVDDQAALAALN